VHSKREKEKGRKKEGNGGWWVRVTAGFGMPCGLNRRNSGKRRKGES